MSLLLWGGLGALPSPHVRLPFLFLPGSVLVLARGWLCTRPLVPGPVPGIRGRVLAPILIGPPIVVLRRLAPLGAINLPLSHHSVSFLFFVFFFVMGFSLKIFSFIMALTVISVNVNGLRDGDKRLAFLQWLSHLSPSVVCLQETHAVSNDDLLS